MISKLTIQTACLNKITYLKECYFTPPFKVANITEDKKAGILQLMLMSSSPGILDGDNYQLKIDVAENCKLALYTQAYQRLFCMKTAAKQNMLVTVADNASFYFIPQPIVPQKSSNFTSRNTYFLGKNCSLLLGEILTCGRKLNGEIFAFSKYHAVTEIYIQNKLVIKENLLLQPANIDITAIGQLQSFTHQASLIYLNETADIKKLIPALSDLLSSQKEISVGISATPVNGLLVRILGQKAAQLFDCLQQIAICLSNEIPFKNSSHAI